LVTVTDPVSDPARTFVNTEIREVPVSAASVPVPPVEVPTGVHPAGVFHVAVDIFADTNSTAIRPAATPDGYATATDVVPCAVDVVTIPVDA
jgi:hypothetical protein